MADRTYTLTYKIEVGSAQKATAVRDAVAEHIEQMDDVEVRLSSMGRSMPEWNVVGVDTTSKQPFTESVEAETEEEAKAKVEGAGKSKTPKVVADVRRVNG